MALRGMGQHSISAPLWQLAAQSGQLIETLRADLRAKDTEISSLLKLADFGCANAPIYRMVRG